MADEKSEDVWTNAELIAHLQSQPPDQPATHISRKRFSEVLGQRNTAREEAQARQAALEVEQATKTKLAADLQAWSGKASAWEEERGILLAGWTDPEAIDALRFAHGRLPAEGRPTLSEYAISVKAAPDKAPKVLQPWLAAPAKPAQDPAPAPAAAAPAPAAKQTEPPPPTGNAGAAPSSAGATPQRDAAAIRAVRQECERTGNWAPFVELTGVKL